VSRAPATAKINLALVVGPRLPTGKHEVSTVLQRLDLSDRVAVEPAAALRIDGFPDDTIVRRALLALAEAASVEPHWRVAIRKRIPVAAGLGGGSADAGTALRLANATLPEPLTADALEALAAEIGADVPFFLRQGPQLGTGDGARLTPIDVPQDFWVVLLVPNGETKSSTADVYRRFDERGGEQGFDERRDALLVALERVSAASDLATLPRNDLARSPHAARLEELGAFRSDVSGAGPAVYGLFLDRGAARKASAALRVYGRTYVTVPVWYA
jgi:4-diphosphocytidyl-2-C-methyl-D-erythritol kinase